MLETYNVRLRIQHCFLMLCIDDYICKQKQKIVNNFFQIFSCNFDRNPKDDSYLKA